MVKALVKCVFVVKNPELLFNINQLKNVFNEGYACRREKAYYFGHKKMNNLSDTLDYLISNNGYATAAGLSAILEGEVSHDQVTRFLSERAYTSIDL